MGKPLANLGMAVRRSEDDSMMVKKIEQTIRTFIAILRVQLFLFGWQTHLTTNMRKAPRSTACHDTDVCCAGVKNCLQKKSGRNLPRQIPRFHMFPQCNPELSNTLFTNIGPFHFTAANHCLLGHYTSHHNS